MLEFHFTHNWKHQHRDWLHFTLFDIDYYNTTGCLCIIIVILNFSFCINKLRRI
jgi:hypothetical protein